MDGNAVGTLMAPSATNSIYSFQVTGTSGAHAFQAQAIDNNGQSATTASVTIIIDNPPKLSMSSPVDGGLINGTLHIAGTVISDKTGTVSTTATLGNLPVLNATTSSFSTVQSRRRCARRLHFDCRVDRLHGIRGAAVAHRNRDLIPKSGVYATGGYRSHRQPSGYRSRHCSMARSSRHGRHIRENGLLHQRHAAAPLFRHVELTPTSAHEAMKDLTVDYLPASMPVDFR